MKPRIVLLSLALALTATAAHSQDIITATIGTRACGPGLTPLSCIVIPVTLQGDTQATAYFQIHTLDPRPLAQWVYFGGSLSTLGQAYIDNEIDTRTMVTSLGRTASEVTSIAASFHGSGYNGLIKISFAYEYTLSTGGRGGGGQGWKRAVTGGTITIVTTPSGLSSSHPIANLTSPNPWSTPDPGTFCQMEVDVIGPLWFYGKACYQHYWMVSFTPWFEIG